jgi:hypothetical protein
VLGLVAISCLSACSARRAVTTTTENPPAEVGVYRGKIEESGGETRRFKLMLYAALPDHLHGEILSPLGSTVMIIDGGAGRLSVTLARDGVSYVGLAREEILERILGVRVSLEELVTGILTGEAGPGSYTVIRGAGPDLGLPESIVFRSDAASLSFELKKLRPLRELPADLGTGQPPDGTEVRELDQLGAENRAGWQGGGS